MSRLEPRCSDGRNLSAAKQSNFERGGHRLSPANQSQKGGLRAKSRQDLCKLFGTGKPDLAHPSLKGDWQGKSKQDLHLSYGKCRPGSEQNPPLQGKSKQDLYVSYGKGKQDYGNPTLKSGSFEHNPPLQGKSKQDLYVSYGKCKSDYDSDQQGKPYDSDQMGKSDQKGKFAK